MKSKRWDRSIKISTFVVCFVAMKSMMLLLANFTQFTILVKYSHIPSDPAHSPHYFPCYFHKLNNITAHMQIVTELNQFQVFWCRPQHFIKQTSIQYKNTYKTTHRHTPPIFVRIAKMRVSKFLILLSALSFFIPWYLRIEIFISVCF